MTKYLRICSYVLGSPSSYMTVQPIPSEFPYIWGKFRFLFYQFSFRIVFYVIYIFFTHPCGHQLGFHGRRFLLQEILSKTQLFSDCLLCDMYSLLTPAGTSLGFMGGLRTEVVVAPEGRTPFILLNIIKTINIYIFRWGKIKSSLRYRSMVPRVYFR
jgi:hypothetical protein